MVDVRLSLQLYIKKYDTNLFLTYTESLTYEMIFKVVHEEFFQYKHLFDLSEFQSTFLIQLTKESLAK